MGVAGVDVGGHGGVGGEARLGQAAVEAVGVVEEEHHVVGLDVGEAAVSSVGTGELEVGRAFADHGVLELAELGLIARFLGAFDLFVVGDGVDEGQVEFLGDVFGGVGSNLALGDACEDDEVVGLGFAHLVDELMDGGVDGVGAGVGGYGEELVECAVPFLQA